MYLRVVLLIFLTSVVFSWFLIILIVFSFNSTNKSSTSVISESSNSYINQTNWAFGSFAINNSLKCSHRSDGIKLLILVHSSATHFQFREVIRKHNVITKSITIFLLGFLEDPALQILIEDEAQTHGDIVQGSFHDSYANLTLKHILGLTWTAKYCSNAQLVLKMDDDIFVNYRLLEQMLDLRYPEFKLDRLVSRTGHKLIACYIQHRMKVIRNTTSRWYVSTSQFQTGEYPDFCSGWAYITTVDVINDLLDQIPNHPLFWIDDVYMTGILRQSVSDIQLESLNKFFNVDVTHVYHWVTNSSLHQYKWRYVFSNANGDINLLSTALAINEMSGHKKCCYPLASSLIKENLIEVKPKHAKGLAKLISI